MLMTPDSFQLEPDSIQRPAVERLLQNVPINSASTFFPISFLTNLVSTAKGIVGQSMMLHTGLPVTKYKVLQSNGSYRTWKCQLIKVFGAPSLPPPTRSSQNSVNPCWLGWAIWSKFFLFHSPPTVQTNFPLYSVTSRVLVACNLKGRWLLKPN